MIHRNQRRIPTCESLQLLNQSKKRKAIKKSMNTNTRSGISAYKYLIKAVMNNQERIKI